MQTPRLGEQRRARILVLGGGFAGVYAAYELQRALADEPVEIAIVNRENFFVFYPLLPEIVSGAVATESILNPIRLVVPEATLYVGEVTAINLDEHRVDIRHGLYRHEQQSRTLDYDALVLALGGLPNTSMIPGLSTYAFDVQRLSTAFSLRNHLIDVLGQADIEADPRRKQALLTFVVIGGGATGVEVVAEIRDLVSDAVAYYPHIEPDDVRVMLVHSENRLFPDFPRRTARYADRLLTKRGVELLYNRRVVRVERDGVALDNGAWIPTATAVAAVGVRPNPLVEDLPVTHDNRGRVVTDGSLRVPRYPDVWAIGDNASVTDPHTGRPYPQTAQHAVREARLVAHNIAAALRGMPPQLMTYRTIGQMVALGHRSAIANIRGLAFSGFPAWWLWRTYYLLQMPRWSKRARIAMDWTLDMLFPPELVQLKVGQPEPSAGVITGVRPAGEGAERS